eukprot:4844356-Pleurochrysis_carterae.AAC.1
MPVGSNTPPGLGPAEVYPAARTAVIGRFSSTTGAPPILDTSPAPPRDTSPPPRIDAVPGTLP